MKLSTKILLAIGITSSVAIATAGWSTYRSARNSIQQLISQHQSELARQTMANIDQLLYRYTLNIQTVGGTVSFQNYLSSSGGDLKKLNDRLQEFQILNGPWNALFIINASGNVVLSTDRERINESVSEDEEIAKAYSRAQARATTSTDVFIDEEYGYPTMIFSAPIVIKETNTFVGAVIGYATWPAITEILASIPSSAHIYDQRGALIASNQVTDRKVVLQQSYSQSELFKQVQLNQQGSLVAKAINHNTNNKVATNEQEALISYITQPGYLDFQGNRWLLSIETPTNLAFRPATQDALKLIIILAPTIALFGLVILLFLYRFVIRPIDGLTVITKQVATGDFRQRASLVSNDEVGQLAGSFNTMTDQLQKSYQHLEDKVKERTQDLAKFQMAVQQANEHIVITDPDGHILYGNHAAELITGFPFKEMLGHTPALWGKQMPLGFYKTFWKQIKEQKKIFIGEFTNKRKNGELYAADAAVTPILSDRGKVLFFVGIERDITKQKEYVQTLNRLAAIINDSDDAIIGKTLDGVVTNWNTGATKLYGYTAAEMTGQLINKLVPEDRHNEVGDILRKVAKGEVIEHYPTTRKQKNGNIIDVSITVSPIRDHNGKIIGASTIARDITKEKQIDKAKTEFVSLASHQLRTPLTAINWYTEMLIDGDAGKLTKTQKEYLQEIYHGNQRMVTLVNMLLNVSRLELGTFTVEPKPTTLSELADDVLNELKPQIISKKLKIVRKYQPSVPVMNIDPKLTRIVFQNLLSNSVKYTPAKGSITVSLNLTAQTVRIAVQDTGYGIPANVQDKIYTKLFRADNARTKDTDGTGLGLYIVKSIVEQSGGRTWFESVENRGTTFYVDLPIRGMMKKEGSKALT